MTPTSRVFEPSRPPGLRMMRQARRRQRGQALTEVVLSALLVLIPTFIFGWALYAYGQARTTALNGARYAAWERTVWHEGPVSGAQAAVRPTDEIEKLMVERFFGKPDAEIRSTYAAGRLSGNADLPSFYSLHNGDKVVDIEAVSVQPKQAARPTLKLYDKGETTSTIGEAYDIIANVMNLVGAEKMELENKGLYVAEVSAKLNAVRNVKTLEDLDLGITQRAAVVTDSWSAGGKEHEEAIVKPLVPVAVLAEEAQPLIDLLNDLDASSGYRLTPFQELKLGCIRGDVVPVDMRIGSNGINTKTLTYNGDGTISYYENGITYNVNDDGTLSVPFFGVFNSYRPVTEKCTG
ncbi:MAG: hypothetical protein FWD67_08795 [Betaproteobacteria bacterium]|nr:hypothetical protein [Betaproteobacteria bacterium]